MENYEEKYKKALKVIESLYNTVRFLSSPDALLTSQTLENTFPELRESEDERIRKGLIAMLSQDRELHSKEIAWLEKQGGKVDVLDDFPTEFERQISHLIASSINNEWEYKKDFVKHTANALLQYAKNELEKQGEQKPIEQDTEVNDLWIYIREWNDKFGRLPKDEDELASCIDYVMKRQKPSWSEEDEEMYNEVLTDIIYTKNDLKTKGCLGLSERAMKALNWFSTRHKSLRPQSKWKPSEEQMEALKYFISFHEDHARSLTTKWEEFKNLESLYNDLKSL